MHLASVTNVPSALDRLPTIWDDADVRMVALTAYRIESRMKSPHAERRLPPDLLKGRGGVTLVSRPYLNPVCSQATGLVA